MIEEINTENTASDNQAKNYIIKEIFDNYITKDLFDDLTFEQSTHLSNLLIKYEKITVLRLFVTSDNEDLHEKYKKYIESHNSKILNDDYPDSGFDLFTPTDTISETKLTIDFNVICSAKTYYNYKIVNTGYYLYPRSSITKKNIRMANCVGIIDSGYRNTIKAIFDVLPNTRHEGTMFERYVQICSPDLSPMFIIKEDNIENMSCHTSRGLGGFGSTGY